MNSPDETNQIEPPTLDSSAVPCEEGTIDGENVDQTTTDTIIEPADVLREPTMVGADESNVAEKVSRKKRRRRRSTATGQETERLTGRNALCLTVDEIAPKMMKTIKNRILVELTDTPRGLNENELTQYIIKSAKRLTDKRRILDAFHDINTNTDLLNLKEIILSVILLQEETYSIEQSKLEEKIHLYEKEIVKKSKDPDLLDPKKHDGDRVRSCDIYLTVLSAAWSFGDNISADEANLLRKLRESIGISSEDHRLLSAHLKKFPKQGCQLHTSNDIHEARKDLQRLGLLWNYRDEHRGDIDVIPKEIALILREDLGIQLQRVNFQRLLEHDFITVTELRAILKDFKMDPYGQKQELITRIAESDVPPKRILNLLDREKLSEMNRSLGLKSSGVKEALIDQLVEFYDDLSFEERTTQDDREEWFNNYELLATRRYADLRAKKLIKKDQEVDSHFEQATDFLFEELLNLKIDCTRKTCKADGRILLDNRQVILWDCKSCETEVNLQDFLDTQFRDYLETERARGFVPLAFLVIAPRFTPQSVTLAHQFKAKTNWDIALVQADALKAIAEYWSGSDSDQERQFNAGLLNRTDVIDKSKADFLISLT